MTPARLFFSRKTGKPGSCLLAPVLLLLGAACAPAVHAEGSPLEQATLKQCYELALKRSETVAIQAEVIKEAQARFTRSLSGILPQVVFADTEKRQDASSDSTQRRSLPESRFTFTQPLFSGFKEFAAIAASKAEQRQRKQELVRARQLLFTDVSDAFYLVKGYEEDLEVVAEIDQVLKDRLADLKQREALGRSRESEVVNTEAKLYQLEANRESVRSLGEVARKLLEFLVGCPVASLADDYVSADGTLPPEEEYVARAAGVAEVLAAGEAVTVARKNITAARAGYFPTVDLVGNSYTRRVGSSAGVDWDVALNVTVPLFDGFRTRGDVQEARALAREAELSLSRTRRQAVLDIRDAYTTLASDQKQLQAYRKAADAAQKNYDLQAEDYRNNLVSNLDVLQALEDLQTVRRSYIVIKNATQRAYWDLKVATGDVPGDTL
jgi:outer membrane protein